MGLPIKVHHCTIQRAVSALRMAIEFTNAVNPQLKPEASENALPPIDLEHLARQTMGDPDLRREVLGMFLDQLTSTRSALAVEQGESRGRIAHTLRGAAAGIGAFAVSECAANVERSPDDPALVERLISLIDEVRAFTQAEIAVSDR